MGTFSGEKRHVICIVKVLVAILREMDESHVMGRRLHERALTDGLTEDIWLRRARNGSYRECSYTDVVCKPPHDPVRVAPITRVDVYLIQVFLTCI